MLPEPNVLIALDAHRGFIMVLMAIDHASYFIARVHSAEFWGTALPVYPRCVLVLDTLGHASMRAGFLFLDGDRDDPFCRCPS